MLESDHQRRRFPKAARQRNDRYGFTLRNQRQQGRFKVRLRTVQNEDQFVRHIERLQAGSIFAIQLGHWGLPAADRDDHRHPHGSGGGRNSRSGGHCGLSPVGWAGFGGDLPAAFIVRRAKSSGRTSPSLYTNSPKVPLAINVTLAVRNMIPVPVSGNDIRPPAVSVASSPAASASSPTNVSGRHSRLNQSKGREVNDATVLITMRSSSTLYTRESPYFDWPN